jgi:hypothetical protein
MWTTPTIESRSPAQSGKRVCPDFLAISRFSASDLPV